MGLLDDAIKEHLELKRRHGADPTEVARLEHEALGPARREPTTAEAPVDEAEPAVAESALEEDDERDEVPADERFDAPYADRDPEPLAGREPVAPEPEPFERESLAREFEHDPAREPEPPEPAAREPEPPSRETERAAREPEPLPRETEGAAREPEPPAREPEAPGRAEPSAREPEPPAEVEQPTQQFSLQELEDAAEEEPEGRPHDVVPADDEGEGEDVLEETPDFLQETPEHDRLWFEQKPPRDFDF